MLSRESLAKEEFKDLMVTLYDDLPALCKSLFPDIFVADFCNIHNEIFNAIADKEKRFKLVLAPRGFGKTSIARAVAMDAILFHKKNFIVYISNSAPNAIMQTETLKHDLLSNKIIRKQFGDVREAVSELSSNDMIDIGIGGEVRDDTFAKTVWVAFGNTLVLPRGCGQQIRGLNWHNKRPDLVIADDIETVEDLMNENTRAKIRKWFFGDVCLCLDNIKQDGEIIYIDTLKHEDALPVYLQKTESWRCVRLEVCDDNYKSNAPEFYSNQDILDLKESYRKAGELDTFYREFRNLPVAPETASFKSQYFQYYDPKEKEQDFKKLDSVVLLDPARSVTPQSDWSAVVGVTIDVANRAYYIRDVFGGMVYPDDLFKIAFDMCKSLGAHVLGYEVTGLNEFITYPIKNAASQIGMYNVELLELKARGRKKEERIKALIPLYRQGLIYHNPTCCGPLEEQLLTFPYSARIDIADALAYMVELVEVGGRYCMEPTPVDNKGKKVRDDLELKKLNDPEWYEDIEYEPPIRIKDKTGMRSFSSRRYKYGKRA